MSLVDDRSKLDETLLPNGQQKTYLVLSEEERAKGFVRPVRHTYTHVGIAGPKHPLRELTIEERERYADEKWTHYEEYPRDTLGARPAGLGRFWTQAELDSVGKGCGAATTMARELAETYARSPYFYSGTFCSTCRTHRPVGKDGEFIWDDGERVGT